MKGWRKNTEAYIVKQLQRIHSLVAVTRAKNVNDLDAGRIANILALWRQGRGDRQIHGERLPEPFLTERLG